MESDETTASNPIGGVRWWVKVAVLMALFVAWVGLGVEELVLGFVAAAVAATASRRLEVEAPAGLHPVGVVRFVPYFLRISFLGGIDVARRAFSPSKPLAPGFIDYRLGVEPDGAAAVFFAGVISLVPGTLCAALDGQGTVLVHVVDIDAGFEEELEQLESRVAAIFGESVQAREEPWS